MTLWPRFHVVVTELPKSSSVFVYMKLYSNYKFCCFSTLGKDFFGCPKNLSLAPDPATAWNCEQRPALVSGLPSEQSKYYRRWTKPRGIASFVNFRCKIILVTSNVALLQGETREGLPNF